MSKEASDGGLAYIKEEDFAKLDEASLQQLRALAEKITDEAVKKDTLEIIDRHFEDVQEQHASEEARKAMTDEANAGDATNGHVDFAKKEPQAKHPGLFQYVYDQSITDPEYLWWKQYHSEWKALALEHKVDTSKARSRSPEEHNHLVSTFMTQAFVNHTDSKVSALSIDAVADVGKCVQATLSVAAPRFCWKDGGRNHEIPTGCPGGWHRDMAECFKGCNGGYYYVGGGTCWQHCKGGYHDHGATCFKHIFDWYGKHHYWTDRMTNFDSRVPCGSNQYKSGALCYLDCGNPPSDSSAADKTSMVNCGYDACSNADAACAGAIAEMIMEAAMTVASIAVLVVTAGTAAPATAAGSALLRRMGSQGAKAVAKYSAMSALRHSVQTFSKKVAKEAAKAFPGNVAGNAIKAYCEVYAKGYYEQLTGTPQTFDPAKLDFTGTVSTYNACTPPNGDVNSVACAKGIVSSLSMVDPSGLLGLASALMHDQCGMHSHRPHSHRPHGHRPHGHRPGKATMGALDYTPKIQHDGTLTDLADAEIFQATHGQLKYCKEVFEKDFCYHKTAKAACPSSCKEQ